MHSYIKRSDVIRQIYAGDAFDLEFVTADEKRGTGGELIQVQGWQILKTEKQPATTGQAAARMGTNPQHDDHGTINIHNPSNHHHPIKVHTALIQTFNGKLLLNG